MTLDGAEQERRRREHFERHNGTRSEEEEEEKRKSKNTIVFYWFISCSYFFHIVRDILELLFVKILYEDIISFIFRVTAFFTFVFLMNASTRLYSIVVRFLNEKNRTTLYRYYSTQRKKVYLMKPSDENNDAEDTDAEDDADDDAQQEKGAKKLLWTTRFVLDADGRQRNKKYLSPNPNQRTRMKVSGDVWSYKAKKVHLSFAIYCSDKILRCLGFDYDLIEIQGNSDDIRTAYEHKIPLCCVSNASFISSVFWVRHLGIIPLFVSSQHASEQIIKKSSSSSSSILSYLNESTTKNSIERLLANSLGSEIIFLAKQISFNKQYVRRMKKIISVLWTTSKAPLLIYPEVIDYYSKNTNDEKTHLLEFDAEVFQAGQKIQPCVLLSSTRKNNIKKNSSYAIVRFLKKGWEKLFDSIIPFDADFVQLIRNRNKHYLKLKFLNVIEPTDEENLDLSLFAERVRKTCAYALKVPLLDSNAIRTSTNGIGKLKNYLNR